MRIEAGSTIVGKRLSHMLELKPSKGQAAQEANIHTLPKLFPWGRGGLNVLGESKSLLKTGISINNRRNDLRGRQCGGRG